MFCRVVVEINASSLLGKMVGIQPMCYYAVYMQLCFLVSRVFSKVWLAERAAISPTNLITDMFMPATSPPRAGPARSVSDL